MDKCAALPYMRYIPQFICFQNDMKWKYVKRNAQNLTLKKMKQVQPKFVLFLVTSVKVPIFNFEAIGHARIEIPRQQN
jgi:hypothetical protein